MDKIHRIRQDLQEHPGLFYIAAMLPKLASC